MALELDVCQTYRIPHSHFLGGPAIWTPQDRDKAIWHRAYRAEFCEACGTHPDEWDPDKGGDRHAYTATRSRCAGCAALEQAQEAYDSGPKEDKGRGVRIVLKRRQEAEGGVDPGAGGQHGAAAADRPTLSGGG